MNQSVTTKVAVISDTHSYLDPRIAEIIRECDMAVHAGDICGVDVLDLMQPRSGKVIAVAGNNDPYCHLTNTALPEVTRFDVEGETIVVEHGHVHGAQQPSHESLRKTHTDAKLIIYGHTHKKVVDKSARPWVVNPGAAGSTRTNGGPSCLIIECHPNDEWHINEFRFSDQ